MICMNIMSYTNIMICMSIISEVFIFNATIQDPTTITAVVVVRERVGGVIIYTEL
jgi:hypothetical protein